MYIPKYFEKNNIDEIYTFLKKYPFWTLFSSSKWNMFSTNIPFIVEKNNLWEIEVFFHLAKSNSQVNFLDNQDIIISFVWPNTYISSTYYKDTSILPTRNFVSVEIKWKVILLDNEKDKINILLKSVRQFEETISDYNYKDHMHTNSHLHNFIIWWKVIIKDINAKWKLSQNHKREKIINVINALKEKTDCNAKNVAEYMEKELISNKIK